MKKGRAVAIVLHDRQLLVMFRRSGGKEYYTLPGGGIELNETAEQAVVREVDEEASLKIEINHQVYEHHYDDGSNQYFFLCRYVSGEPMLSPDAPEQKAGNGEIHQPMWLSTDKLAETLLYPLEIRDWIIQDLTTGFPATVRGADLAVDELRQALR